MDKIYIVQIFNGVHISNQYVFSKEKNAKEACDEANQDCKEKKLPLQAIVVEYSILDVQTGELDN